MGFINDSKEYIIENMFPRRMLVDYLWSDSVMHSLDHFGGGTSMACIGTLRRPITSGEKLVYIKDENGFFAANRNFHREKFNQFFAVVGLGYHKVVSEYRGVKVETTFTVPEKGYAECSNIRITNLTDKRKSLQVYFYCKPFVNTSCHTSYSRADYNKTYNGLLYTHNGYQLPHEYNTVFACSDTKLASYAVTDGDFIGEYNKSDSPIGIQSEKLNNFGATFNDSFCAAMQFCICLEPNEQKDINIAVAVGKTAKDAWFTAQSVCSAAAYDACLAYQRQLHEKYNSVFMATTPDEYYNSLVNVWLKRQISLGKTWGRGYGKGFRDVMQDCAAFVSLDVSTARGRILYALKHQFESGNTLRQYEPENNEPYMDGAVWIPATILAYLKESGDFLLLDERVGFYKSTEIDTVFGHMKRGLMFFITSLGSHGLVLWGGGDWNDSLNGCGIKGIGESVWLSIATVKAINEYSEICARVGIDCSEFVKAKNSLTENILKYGFEDDRFIYGYNDNNEKIGSKESEQAKIYLNPQTWAVLSGIAEGAFAEKLFATVDKTLKCSFGYKQCNPSYSYGSDGIGRASYFVEGLVENGAVYNHGVTFKIMADCMLGNGELAYKDFSLMRPDNKLNPNNGMEPYAISNMYIGEECPYVQMRGYAPMSWITGTAGWLYRDLTEGILGITAEFDGLKVCSKLPRAWTQVTVKRVFRGAEYEITLKNQEGVNTLDGKPFTGNVLPYDGKHHKAEIAISF